MLVRCRFAEGSREFENSILKNESRVCASLSVGAYAMNAWRAYFVLPGGSSNEVVYMGTKRRMRYARDRRDKTVSYC